MKYLLHIRYDGSNYSGYQRQKNANTVGEELFTALKSVFGSVTELAGCSRTDCGVHALDYCVSFNAEKTLPCETVVKAVNSYLPCDIAAFDCENVPDDFHARYSVTEKEYIYAIYTGSARNPFYENRVMHHPRPLDVAALNALCPELCGTHDFSAFMASGSDIKDTVRTVYRAYFKEENGLYVFHIAADGFLYNMVRIIVGTLLDIHDKKLDNTDVSDIIASRERSLAGKTAAACGLYLYKVSYGRE